MYQSILTKSILYQHYIKEGLNTYQIAQIYKCKPITINRYLRKFHIKIRKSSDYLKGKSLLISHRKKISKTRIQRKVAKGKRNPMWKQTHTKNTKKKISMKRKGFKVSNKTKNKISQSLKQLNRIKNIIKTSDGYIYLYLPNHPRANKNGRIRQHRLIVENFLKRYIKQNESVHHLDLNKTNNKINNLIVFSNISEHNKFHTYIYQYLLETKSIKEIKKYIQWFQKKEGKNVLFMP